MCLADWRLADHPKRGGNHLNCPCVFVYIMCARLGAARRDRLGNVSVRMRMLHCWGTQRVRVRSSRRCALAYYDGN